MIIIKKAADSVPAMPSAPPSTSAPTMEGEPDKVTPDILKAAMDAAGDQTTIDMLKANLPDTGTPVMQVINQHPDLIINNAGIMNAILPMMMADGNTPTLLTHTSFMTMATDKTSPLLPYIEQVMKGT